MIEIFDNFLEEKKYIQLYSEFNSGRFPWYLSPTTLTFDNKKAKIFNTETKLLFHLFYYAP